MFLRKISGIGLVLLFVAGCASNGGKTPDINPARSASFPDKAFLERLRSGYIEMSDYEWSRGNKDAAKRFGQKAMATVNGIEPEIDPLYNRNIELAKMNELLGAKYFLEAAFVKGIKKQIPEPTAKAQIFFDCWVEETEHPQKKNKNCRPQFEENRKIIADTLDDMKKKEAAAAVPSMVYVERNDQYVQPDLENENVYPVQIQERNRVKTFDMLAERKSNLTTKMPDPSIIFFKYDSTEIGVTGQNIIAKAARDIDTFNPTKVIIAGNTDKTGSYNYNMSLAMKRAQKVADYLVERFGVSPSLLDVKAYGKNNPRVNPELIAKDVRNRYVAIIFLNEDKTYYLEDQGY